MKKIGLFFIMFLFVFSIEVIADNNTLADDKKFKLSNKSYQRSNVIKIINEKKIISLLLKKDFDAIKQLLGSVDKEFNSDPAYEWKYINAYEVFGKIGNPKAYLSAIRGFNQWVEKDKSYIAYAVRGFYKAGIANKYRGTKYINDTKQEDLKKAVDLWKSALADFDIALKINDKCLPVYSEIIKILRRAGNAQAAESVVSQAILKYPQTYYIRANYLIFQQPKWGGSYEKASKFVEASQVYGDINPRIWNLRGNVDASKGYQCLLNKDVHCAISYYSKALKYGHKNKWLSYKAYAYYKNRRYKDALDTSKIILEYTPEDKHAKTLVSLLENISTGKQKHNTINWGYFDRIP